MPANRLHVAVILVNEHLLRCTDDVTSSSSKTMQIL
jgi:hypothetical protein